MTDILTILGLAAFGNYLNKSGIKSRATKEITNRVPLEDLPSDQNIYHSERSLQVDQEVRKEATKNFIAANDPCNTNIIPAFYNTIHNNSCGPLEGTELSKTLLPQEIGSEPTSELDSRILTGPMWNNPVPEEFSSVPKGLKSESISELTGLPVDTTHNNMVPFFGAKVTQNLDDARNETLLEAFTGRGPTVQRNKQEVGPMFELQKENIFGTPNLPDEYRNERYYQSNKKTNILPTPQVRTFAPKVEEMPRPKYYSIDELRSKSDPQISFQSRPSGAPQGTSQRGQLAPITKKKAPKYHNTGSSRFLPAISNVSARQLDENFVTNLKHTNRHQNEEYHIGPGGAVSAKGMRPSICRPRNLVSEIHSLRPEQNDVVPRMDYRNQQDLGNFDLPEETPFDFNAF